MQQKESRRFIEIQTRFVERLVDLSNDDLGEVLEKHTVFRQILGMPYGDEIRNHPIWQEFVDGLSQQSDRVNWINEFHLAHLPSPGKPEEPRFGCFYYDYHFRPVIRLHFGNPTTESVLNKESMEIRKNEIRSLFKHIQHHHPEAEQVRGSSWLYNIEAYQRLFPPEYVESARHIGYETGFFSLWGQFLRGDRSIREDVANQFLDCLRKQTTVNGCIKCFPYEVLRPECPRHDFYNFYKVERSNF